MTSQTTMTGIAGELLTCLDIRSQGYTAFLSSADCAYDIVLDTGSRLYRVQVKSTNASVRPKMQKNPSWVFNIKRQGHMGRLLYEQGDYDILALAALDTRKVAYLPQTLLKSTISLRSTEHDYCSRTKPGIYFEDLPLEKAIAGVPAA